MHCDHSYVNEFKKLELPKQYYHQCMQILHNGSNNPMTPSHSTSLRVAS